METSGNKIGHPFKTPEGYFEALPMKIQQRIQQKPHSVWQGAQTWGLRLALPVALLALGLAYYRYQPQPDAPLVSRQTEALLQEVSVAEVESYLLHEDEVSEHELYEVAIAKNVNISAEDLEASDEYILDEIDSEDLEGIMN